MAPIKAKHLCTLKMFDAQVLKLRKRMVGGGDKKQPLAEERLDFKIASIDRQRPQKHVEGPSRKGKCLVLRNAFPDMQPQIRLFAMERSDDRRHQIGAKRRCRTEAHRSGQTVTSTACKIANILRLDDQTPCSHGDFATDRRQVGASGVALDQPHSEPILERTQLLAKGGLRNIAGASGPTEVPQIPNRDKIFKLS